MLSACVLLACMMAASCTHTGAEAPGPAPHSLIQSSFRNPQKTLVTQEISANTKHSSPQQEHPGGNISQALVGAGLSQVRTMLYDATIGRFQSAEEPQDPKVQYQLHYVLDGLMLWGVWMMLAIIMVYTCYQRGYVPREAPAAHCRTTFEQGHFNCFNDASICCWSFFCPGIRWADTLSQAKLLGFWPAFAAWSLLAVLNVMTSGVFVVGIFTICLCMYYRMQLRKKLKMPTWKCSTTCVDFCFLAFCACCAIAQEAKVVQQAIQKREEGFDEPEPERMDA